ncbi:MAG: CocE/NonD family hydrolase C-terminal non-catalytic domain-containing protein [Roseobacter sp.]
MPDNPAVGHTSGDIGHFGYSGGVTLEQPISQPGELVCETAPTDEDNLICAAPHLEPTGEGWGHIVVFLIDVAPDKTTTPICYGIRDLALGTRVDHPVDDPPGAGFRLWIDLHRTAYRLAKGHRLCVALSTSLWPLVRDTCRRGAIRISKGQIILPRLSAPVGPMKTPLPRPKTCRQKKHIARWYRIEVAEMEIGAHQIYQSLEFVKTGPVFGYETRMVHQLYRTGALKRRTEVEHTMTFERPDGIANAAMRLQATSEDERMEVHAQLDVAWNQESIWH